MKTIIRLRFLCALFLLVSGCAPEFGLTMRPPSVPEDTAILSQGSAVSALRVRIGAFDDARPSKTIAVVDGREIPSQGSVGAPVQQGFEQYWRDSGVRVVQRDAPIIDGEVVEWRVKVSPDFPSSEAIAFAKIKLRLKDSEYHLIYTASFNGEASVSHPFLDEDQVRDVLGQAMGSAIRVAVEEESLLEALKRGRIE